MSKPLFKNVPAPPGSKAGGLSGRFIPREELGDFASWQPGALAGAGQRNPAASAPSAASAASATPSAAAPSAQEWLARVAAARQQGYQDGYRDGLAALESFKQSFASQATAQVGALLEAIDAQTGTLDQDMARTLARVATQLARQVLRAELQVRPELVARVATEAVNAVLLSARHISVQVHPLDLPLVAEGAEEALLARGARLLANPRIERGGVLVESDVGAIDARIGSRWAAAAASWADTSGRVEPWAPVEATEPDTLAPTEPASSAT